MFSLAVKDDRVKQCLVGWPGVHSKCGVQSKRRCESHESCFCIVGFPACGCQKKSVVYETECRHQHQHDKKPEGTVFVSQT